MCGIVGFWRPAGLGPEISARRVVEDMRDSLIHRGPDDAGTWLDGEAGIAFGFRRLSIIDLSAAGHQPMHSTDGRFVLLFNGEAYNFAAIRREIEAVRGPHPWRGHCDAEVVLEAIAQWGVEAAVQRINGMFALAVWDRRDRVLSLARDRMGKKPLYCGWAGASFVFGSELKALERHPEFDDRLRRDALLDVLQLGYVLGRRSIFSSIDRLPGGHVLSFGPAAAARRETLPSRPYWDLHAVALEGLEAQASGRVATEDELAATLEDAVALRLVADVPVGVFLSGGIDSSLVTALAARASSEPVRSFSIGFRVPGWDEAGHARGVAAHLGTRHEEFYLDQGEIIAAVQALPGIVDEPFGDDSLIPTLLLSRLARRSVTVALSGDGGDELFGGYDRYAVMDRWLARRDALPGAIRAPLARLAHGLAHAAGGHVRRRTERRLNLLGQLLENTDVERMHEVVVSQAATPGTLLAGGGGARRALTAENAGLGRSSSVDRMTFLDASTYLVDDILTKVDRASMAASLEVRCPLLDHRIVALSWRFPAATKIQGRQGKMPLRHLLHRHVPPGLVERLKMGFGAPVEIWLRSELRDWAEALMTPAALARNPMLDAPACRRLWEDFSERGRGWDRVIWNLLMVQAWQEARTARSGASLALA